MKYTACFVLAVIIAYPFSRSAAHAGEAFAAVRNDMVAEIEAMVSETSGYTGIDRLRPPVVQALQRVSRHEFVPAELEAYAYRNQPLAIGHDQTISQPYIVALMTELADVDADSVVLEVGTGSGYQAAILAQLVDQVFTVERINDLLVQARKRFQELNLRNIRLKHSDGSWGWKANAPYDGILVTAAPAEIPADLCQQLADGGRMVIPVGGSGKQKLQCVTRTDDAFEVETLELVSFVPLLGGTS